MFFEKPIPDSESAAPKTPRAHFLLRLGHFSKIRPPYWIRHFIFRKTGSRFGISDPELVKVATFFYVFGFIPCILVRKMHFLIKMSAILDPPFWKSKNPHQIRNQRPRKPLEPTLCGDWSIFEKFVRHIGSAILFFEKPIPGS